MYPGSDRLQRHVVPHFGNPLHWILGADFIFPGFTGQRRVGILFHGLVFFDYLYRQLLAGGAKHHDLEAAAVSQAGRNHEADRYEFADHYSVFLCV